MKFLQIKETCLYFHDLGIARDFYHKQLELPIISYSENRHIFFRAGSSVLLCFNPEDSRRKKSPPPHFATGKYHFALEVRPEDYDAHKREIMERGITIIDSVAWESGQESFYFEDPIGNVVEIIPSGVWGNEPPEQNLIT